MSTIFALSIGTLYLLTILVLKFEIVHTTVLKFEIVHTTNEYKSIAVCMANSLDPDHCPFCSL